MLTVSLFKRRGRNRFQVPSEVNTRISLLGRDTLAANVSKKSAASVSFLKKSDTWFIRNIGIRVYKTTRRHIQEHRNVKVISLILLSILRQFYSLFQSQFSTQYDLLRLLSISSTISFAEGHAVAAYVFLLFSYLSSSLQ